MAITRFKLARLYLSEGMDNYTLASSKAEQNLHLKFAFNQILFIGKPLRDVLGRAIEVMRFEIYGWHSFVDDITSFCEDYKTSSTYALNLGGEAKSSDSRQETTMDDKSLMWAYTFVDSVRSHMLLGLNMMGEPLGSFFRGIFRLHLEEAFRAVLNAYDKKPGDPFSGLATRLK